MHQNASPILRTCILSLALLSVGVKATHATVFRLGGHVTDVSDPGYHVDIQVDDPWAFEFEFDPDAEPSSFLLWKAIYTGWTAELTVGEMQGETRQSQNYIYLYNDSGLSNNDAFDIGAGSYAWDGFGRVDISILMRDLDGTVFSSFDMPRVPPNVADFETTSFWVGTRHTSSGDQIYIDGAIESFTLVPDPSAGTSMLLLAILMLRGSRIRAV